MSEQQSSGTERFNPTRVRLKPLFHPSGTGSSASFNPTRVRLKHYTVDSSDYNVTELQPHEGSSETQIPSGCVSRPASFNPTRVRLKLDHPGGDGDYLWTLQPHEGSSETRRFTYDEAIFRCFNPTRVRLKLDVVLGGLKAWRASTPRGFV